MAAAVHNVLRGDMLSGDPVKGFSYPGLLPVIRGAEGAGVVPAGLCGVVPPSGPTKEPGPGFGSRKQREFIPDAKKDESYWDRRRRNNEAAKRSREKRRFNDMILEQKVLELSKEAHILRAQVNAFENKFHVKAEDIINEDQVLSSLPQADQLLALNRRSNVSLLSMRNSPSNMLSPTSSTISSPPLNISGSLAEEDNRIPLHLPPHHPHPYSTPSPYTPAHFDSTPQMEPPSHHHVSHHHSPQRSHSPDYYHPHHQPDSDLNSHANQDLPQYNSQEEQFYSTNSPSTALNLSARSNGSHSPEQHMEFSEDNLSPENHGRSLAADSSSNGSSLPLKLRHKGCHSTNGSRSSGVGILSSHLNSHYLQHRPLSTSPLSDHQDVSSTSLHHHSPPHHLYGHHETVIKTEQRSPKDDEPGLDSAYDSGNSVTSSPPLRGIVRDSPEHMDCSSGAHLSREHDQKFPSVGAYTEIPPSSHRLSINPHVLDSDYTSGLNKVDGLCIRRVYKKRSVEGEPTSSTDDHVIKAELAKIYGELHLIKSKMSRDTIDNVNSYNQRS